MIEYNLHQVGSQSNPVAIDLLAQARIILAMGMVQQCCRRVHQFVTSCDDLEECCHVFTILRWSAGPKGQVKSADAMEEGRCKGHTCACAKASCSVGI